MNPDGSPQRAFVLDGMLKNNDLLSAAWHCKEAFYDIWGHEQRRSRHEAETLFDAWKGSIPKEVEEFKGVAKTIDAWREQVFAYFDHPFSNAYTEAANGLIKIANRAGRGYRFDAIRAKAINIRHEDGTRLFVCESCLGQFDARIRCYYEPPPRAGYPRIQRLCGTCFRLHTPEWFRVDYVYTPKSG